MNKIIENKAHYFNFLAFIFCSFVSYSEFKDGSYVFASINGTLAILNLWLGLTNAIDFLKIKWLKDKLDKLDKLENEDV